MFVTQSNAVCLASVTHLHETIASFLHAAFELTFCSHSDVNPTLSRVHTWTRLDEHWWAYRCGRIMEERQTAFGHLPNRLRPNEHYPSRVGTSKRMHSSFVLTLPHLMLWQMENLLSISAQTRLLTSLPALFKYGCGFIERLMVKGVVCYWVGVVANIFLKKLMKFSDNLQNFLKIALWNFKNLEKFCRKIGNS